MSEIKSEVFVGSVHAPERSEEIVRQHAEAVSQYYKITPCGGADKTEIRQVISAPVVEKAAHEIDIPARETEDYPTLAAWYSGYSFCEHYRKVVQAQCQEIVRAKAAVTGEKITEARIDALARLHPIYLSYLADHLRGRTLWEAEYRAAGGIP